MSRHIITDKENVECPYCNELFNVIHWKHLKRHEKTFEDFRNEYPNSPSITKAEDEKSRNHSAKMRKAQNHKSTKIVGCCHCNENVEVNINRPNKHVMCDKCKGLGLKSTSASKPIKTKIKEKIEKIKEQKNKIPKEVKEVKEVKETKIDKVELQISKSNVGVEFPVISEEKVIVKPKHKITEIADFATPQQTEKIIWKCSTCGVEFSQIWNSIREGYNCPKCHPENRGFSEAEQYIVDFIKSLNVEIIENDRTTIHPHELDIYIPSHNLAIEFDSLYWHSEINLLKTHDLNGSTVRRYHHLKNKLCTEKGIQLITIFEDEWTFKPEIVKNRLSHLLGISQEGLIRVHARKCEIKEIPSNIKNAFLNAFHIQGTDSSIIKLGAFYKNNLIAVMTFSKGNISKGNKNRKDVWELNRFASNSKYHIPGIASKLLSHFKKNYVWNEIFSYADRRWSNGNLYRQIGFQEVDMDDPKINYWYIKDKKRTHRFCYRKRPDEPKDVTEWVLRQQEGLDRIWDCGNYKFKLANTRRTDTI